MSKSPLQNADVTTLNLFSETSYKFSKKFSDKELSKTFRKKILSLLPVVNMWKVKNSSVDITRVPHVSEHAETIRVEDRNVSIF